MKWCLGVGIAIIALPALAAEPGDLDFVAASSLPQEIIGAFAGLPAYAYEARINPFYLQGDFDGDGRRDTAVLVKEKSSGKHGIGIALRGRKTIFIGAGTELPGSSDDFAWMDAWVVQPKGPVAQGATDEAPPKLRGDAILAIKTESASGLIWWDGKRFRWYQQGD